MWCHPLSDGRQYFATFGSDPEFILVAAKFIVEEDADALQKELKEAFRLYDKEGTHR